MRPPTPPTPERPTGLRWWREVLYILVFYAAYSFVRNQFGSGRVTAAEAFGNARTVIRVERWPHLFFEPHLQSWFLGAHWFLKLWNIWYGTAHFIVTPIALAILYRRAPDRFRRWRNVIFLTSGLALIGYSTFPLMPPRLLNEPPSRMGAGAEAAPVGPGSLAKEDYGFVDTMSRYGGLWSFDDKAVQKVSNQYAAMPSLHGGWSAWCALVLVPLCRRRWLKLLAGLYPAAMLFCIIVTANHFWLDAAAGWTLLTIAIVLTGVWDRRTFWRLGSARPPVDGGAVEPGVGEQPGTAIAR